MNKQYEIARIITKNYISNEMIDKELSSLTKEEWDKHCMLLDRKMKESVKGLEKAVQENAMLQTLDSISLDSGISTTVLWIAYLKWLDVEYAVK